MIPKTHTPFPPGGWKYLVPVFSLALLGISRFPLAAGTSVESRLSTGWEYDDNVLEDPSGKTPGGAGTASLFSTVRLDSPNSASRFDYQIGYKAHHRLTDNDTLTAGDVLVHRLQAGSERRLGGSVLGTSGELKLRNVYHKNPFNLLSEEGYVRGQGQLYLKHPLGSRTDLTAGLRLAFFDFETFQTFNYRSIGPRLRLTRRLAESLAGAAEYSFTRRSYDRPASAPGARGDMEATGYEQRDNLHQLDLSLAFGRGWLVNFIYTLQHNGSNNYGFSYWNNRFSLLYGRRLPTELFLNAYLFFELRRYSDQTNLPILLEAITEENDNNGAVIKLSRPLGQRLEASATWSLYRNQSSLRDLDFHKNLIDFALTCRF